MCSWGKAVSTFFKRTFGVLFRQVPILGSLFEIAAVGLCMWATGGLCADVVFVSTSFVAGVTSGNLGYALKAGLISGVTAIANFGVGTLTQGLGIAIEGLGEINPLNIAGHALVGCASVAASGGSCGSGAAAGAASSAATPFISGPGGVFPNPKTDAGDLIGGTVASATVGGLASVAGGGKFANGAVTGAFDYLFNYLRHVDGLPIRRGTNPITVFDSVVADQVLGFFDSLRSAGVPIELSGTYSAFRTTEMQEEIPTDNPN